MRKAAHCIQTGQNQLSYVTPIRRKGCKNVGLVWSEEHQQRVVVPLHPGKPVTFVTKNIQIKKVKLGNSDILWIK